MKHLISGVMEAVERECWYAAVALALAIPDVCASIDDAVAGARRQNGDRYREWCARYVAPRIVGPDGRVFLTGEELWSARNAFVHGGSFVTRQAEPTSMDDSVAMFERLNVLGLFVSDPPVIPARQLTRGDGICRASYNVSVHELCLKICDGASEWFESAAKDAAKSERMHLLPRITQIDEDGHQRPV